jgi:hypothetical protein
MYGFVRERIVPVVASIAELRGDTLGAFFSGTWATRFREYDASYGVPADVVEASVRAAVRRVCGGTIDTAHG